MRLLAHAGAVDETLSLVMLFVGLWLGWAGWSRLKGRGFPRLPSGAAVALLVVAGILSVSALIVPRMIFPLQTPADEMADASMAPGTRPASTATLVIAEPREGAAIEGDELEVVMDLEGGRIVETTRTQLTPDTGHVHVTLDGELVSMTYGLVQVIDLRDVPDGEHTLGAEYVAADHAPFHPRVVATVTFRTEGGRR